MAESAADPANPGCDHQGPGAVGRKPVHPTAESAQRCDAEHHRARPTRTRVLLCRQRHRGRCRGFNTPRAQTLCVATASPRTRCAACRGPGGDGCQRREDLLQINFPAPQPPRSGHLPVHLWPSPKVTALVGRWCTPHHLPTTDLSRYLFTSILKIRSCDTSCTLLAWRECHRIPDILAQHQRPQWKRRFALR